MCTLWTTHAAHTHTNPKLMSIAPHQPHRQKWNHTHPTDAKLHITSDYRLRLIDYSECYHYFGCCLYCHGKYIIHAIVATRRWRRRRRFYTAREDGGSMGHLSNTAEPWPSASSSQQSRTSSPPSPSSPRLPIDVRRSGASRSPNICWRQIDQWRQHNNADNRRRRR